MIMVSSWTCIMIENCMHIVPFLSRGGQYDSRNFPQYMPTHIQPLLLQQRLNIRVFCRVYSHSAHNYNRALKSAIFIQHILPSFNQTTVNPWDFLCCVCSGHYNSSLTLSAACELNSKCGYTFLLICETRVNRQVKSGRQLTEFCVVVVHSLTKKSFTSEEAVWAGFLQI